VLLLILDPRHAVDPPCNHVPDMSFVAAPDLPYWRAMSVAAQSLVPGACIRQSVRVRGDVHNGSSRMAGV